MLDPATALSDSVDSSDLHRREGNDSPQRIAQCIFGAIKLVTHLQVHPESRGRTEVAGETHGSVGRDPPLPMDDFIDTTGRNTDRDGELVLRNSEPLDEVFHEDFARVNRSNFSGSQRSQPLLDQLRPGLYPSRLRLPRAARIRPNKRADTIALHRKIR